MTGGRAAVRAVDPGQARPAGRPVARIPGRADHLLALQRTIGNAAVVRHLQRCACGGGNPASCACPDEELEEQDIPKLANRAVLARRALTPAPRRSLQRLDPDKPPPYQKTTASWATKGSENPANDCTPIEFKFIADQKWKFYAKRVPQGIKDRCGCQLAADAYTAYFEANKKYVTLADDTNCISQQLAQDDAAHTKTPAHKHAGAETDLMSDWDQKRDAVLGQALAGGAKDVELDLVKAADGTMTPTGQSPLTERDVSKDVIYGKNTLAGGVLFGAGNVDGKDDSEYGKDTRHVSGTIKVHRTDDDSNPNWMEVDEVVTFKYHMKDALDFCPANTLRKSFDFEYNQLLSDLSRLEASGMTRDVGYDVRYHRTRQQTHHSVHKQAKPPPPPPEPKPPPTPPPTPRPSGKLKAARFQVDGEPQPKLQACYDDRARLREGDRGEPVAMVQRALSELAPVDLGTSGPNRDGVDGVYGGRTAKAVRDFKAREGLGFEQYGDVGPGTMRRLDELFSAA